MDDGSTKGGGGLVALAIAPFAAVAALLFLLVIVLGGGGGGPGTIGCGVGGASGAVNVPSQPVAGYSGEQLENAAIIMQVASERGLTIAAQEIGVMVAMGESSLQVLDEGDAAGPDSRGLFQQRDNWGPYEVRMDPAGSAGLFFDALVTVPGWETMEPTLAAHAVQRNQDPFHYERYAGPAREVVAALAGTGGCSAAVISADGWTLPLSDSHITSPFGYRTDPIEGGTRFHNGVDLDNGGPDPVGCGAPLWAAGTGTVSAVFQDSYGAWIIEIDHGGGVVSWTVHMEREGVLVQEGQTVNGGDQIGTLGSSGYSTGCHLHYEIRVNGEHVDPITFLGTFGVAAP